MNLKGQVPLEARVRLSEEKRQRIREEIGDRKYDEFALEIGLSIYVLNNLVNRARSISYKNYIRIFGEEPGPNEKVRVDGAFFRRMVEVWQHLTGISNKGIYLQLSSQNGAGEETIQRIVNGAIKTVDKRLEDFVRRKLSEIVPESELESTIEQHEKEDHDVKEKRYSYDEIKLILDYLKENLGISTNRILRRSPSFYEKHKSWTISGEIYRYAENLMERAKRALSSWSWEEIDNIINEVYGKKPGERIPYQRIKPLVDYLEARGVSIKKLVGRSKSYYTAGFKTVSKGVYVAIVEQYLAEEENEHAMQVPEGTFPFTTFTEVRRLANAVFDGYDVSQMASTLAELTTGRSIEGLVLCLTDQRLSLRNTDVAFEALGRMSLEQLRVARKSVEYDNKSVHYPGELVYVLGVKQFGVVTNVEGEQNLNESTVFVRTFPSQREIKLFSGAVKNITYRRNTHK